MKITTAEKQRVLEVTVNYLINNPGKKRSEIIEAVLLQYGYTKDTVNKSQNPNSKINSLRSLVGNVITDMVSKKQLKLDKEKKHFLIKEQPVIVKEAECRAEVMRLIKSKGMKKSEIYKSLQKKFGTDKTKSDSDDNELKSMAGQILSTEVAQGRIQENNGIFSLKQVIASKKFEEVLSEEQFEEKFLARINELGGAFFEVFVAHLLEKYYQLNGRVVHSCSVIGGCDDGGADIVLDTMDDLGFVEKVIVQTKNRKSMHVTEKEIREFYGVMYAQKGSRGIFVTTSTFHSSAEKLLLSLPNCVGIDGKKLFSLAKQAAYGMRESQKGFEFDDSIFL